MRMMILSTFEWKVCFIIMLRSINQRHPINTLQKEFLPRYSIYVIETVTNRGGHNKWRVIQIIVKQSVKMSEIVIEIHREH